MMRTSDRDKTIQAAIIPFEPRRPARDDVQVSTIAALVAVIILHGVDERPEDKLLELIEQSGDAEIVDEMDATDGLSESNADMVLTGNAYNDNEVPC